MAGNTVMSLAARAVRTVRHWRAGREAGSNNFRRLALNVTQSGPQLTIEAITTPGLHIRALVARTASGERLTLAQLTPEKTSYDGLAAHRVTTTIDIAHVVAALAAAGYDSVTADPSAPRPERTITFELAIFEQRSEVPKHAFVMPPAAMAELADKDQRPPHAYWAALGRCEHTALTGLGRADIAGVAVETRLTRYGHVTLVFGDPVPPPLDVRTRGLAISDGVLHLSGLLQGGARPLADPHLVLLGRHTSFQLTAPVTVKLDEVATAREWGRHTYRFAAQVDLRRLIDDHPGLPPHSLADLWITAAQEVPGSGSTGSDSYDAPLPGTDNGAAAPYARARVGRLPFELRNALRSAAVDGGATVLEVTPYLTVKKQNLSLEIEPLTADAYQAITQLHADGVPLAQRALSRVQKLNSAPRAQGSGRPVWLVGERPDTAQDNGLHFFRYLRRHRRDIDAYYVITRDSPDRANLADLDHVIDFGSLEHVQITARADRIVGTHHANYLFPTRTADFQKLITSPRVFLQHGVIGMKWMANTYAKYVTDFETDVFCVSSEREKAFIVNDLGYDPAEIAVTGLARFDRLFADDVIATPGQVLVMPTWRPWLTNEDAFAQSAFREQWRALLSDPRLAALREQRGVRVLFYLHSNMSKYADEFRLPGVEFVPHGTRPIQDLLKESSVLVTDYSSPAFDFAFLGKPVIFFQFDRGRMFGKTGGHMDIDAELPGMLAGHVDQVVERLETVTAPGFELEDTYRQSVATFLTHRDQRNCERITVAVAAARRTGNPVERIRHSRNYQLLEKRTRRSRIYFPLMRAAYRVMKLLPMDNNTIVFEASLSKQFNDNPRAIYDELVRREDPRRRVWIYDRTPPVDDPQLVVVKRNSPRYFYFWARAKWWVSNQNLPYYITRRTRGVYIQTWHGTPLKRMLHDLDQIVGRDEGYVDRVSTAISQWSVLLSPSPFATKAFRSAFRYHGPVLESGYPRNDVLLGERAVLIRAQVRERLGISPDQQVVLYAPTFRDNQKSGNNFHFQLPFDVADFAAHFGGDAVLLLRAHMLVANRLSIPIEVGGAVRDVSSHSEVSDLYLAADVLVTDYSSVLFDFALTGKPMVFYAYDLAQYRDDIRGFYLDYLTDLPGPIAHTPAELFAAIAAARHPSAEQRQQLAAFARRFGPFDDGHAAARVVDQLLTP